MSGAWQILGLSMHRAEIENGTLEETNTELAGYGIALTRLGNLDINLDDDDNARLKKLAGDTAYSRLAGGYLQAAQAEMMQGAGQGMAQGGAAVSPIFLGAGLGLGQNMGVPQQAPGYPPPPAPGFAGGGQGYAPPGPPAPQHAPAPPARPAPQQAPPPQPGPVSSRNSQHRVAPGARPGDPVGHLC